MSFPIHKSKQGFASISLLFILGFALSIMFSFGYLSQIAKSKIYFRNVCLNESIQLQKKIILAEKALFALNPLSTALMVLLETKKIELLAAIAAENGYLVAKLTLEIRKIQAEQEALDANQKNIITMTNFMILSEIVKIEKNLNNNQIAINQKWDPLFQATHLIKPRIIPRMAVKPAKTGIAPNYELEANYKQLQIVAFDWLLRLGNRKDKQTVFTSNNFFTSSCGIIANKSESKWNLEIEKDKY